jgi:hypothetical protein
VEVWVEYHGPGSLSFVINGTGIGYRTVFSRSKYGNVEPGTYTMSFRPTSAFLYQTEKLTIPPVDKFTITIFGY